MNVVITVEATQTTTTSPTVTPSPQPDRKFLLNVTDITPINWVIANINVSNTIWRVCHIISEAHLLIFSELFQKNLARFLDFVCMLSWCEI